MASDSHHITTGRPSLRFLLSASLTSASGRGLTRKVKGQQTPLALTTAVQQHLEVLLWKHELGKALLRSQGELAGLEVQPKHHYW